MTKFFLLLLGFILSSFTYAQFKLETIVHTQDSIIEEEEDEGSLTAETIENISAGSSNLDEILASSPAATTSRGPRSSSETPQVRGLDKNKIYAKVDGARENFQSGHSAFIALDTENLKTVKIQKSSSDISQTGSIGGGVEFITKDAKDFLKKGKSYGGEFGLKTSSANREENINAKAIQVSKNFDSYISLSSARASDTKLSDGSTLDNSSFKDFAALYKANLLKYYTLKLEYFKREDDAPTDPALNPPNKFLDLQSDNITTKQNLTVEYKKSGLKINSTFSKYEQEKIDRETDESTTKEIETIDFTVDKQIKTIKIGAEFFQDKLDSVNQNTSSLDVDGSVTPAYPKAISKNYMGYISKQQDLAKGLRLDLGLRADSYEMSSNDFSESKRASKLSKSFIMTTTPSEGFDVYAKYSEGFKAPSLVEVYPSGLHFPGDGFFVRDNFFKENPELEHETSITHEIGTKFSRSLSGEDLLELGLSFYNTEAKNYITREQIDRSVLDEENGTTQFVNEKEVELYGVEASVNYLYDQVETGLSYTKVRGKITSKDLFLEDLPADQYQLSVKYYLDQYDLKFGIESILTEEQNRVNEETLQRTEETPSYLVHNFMVSKRFNNFNFNFRINNVTNLKYRKHASFLYESQRDYKLGLKYKINTF